MAPKKQDIWTPLEIGETTAITRTGGTTGEVIMPFALGEDEHGEVFTAMHVTKVCVNPTNGAHKEMPWLRLMLPGVCGHYDCGGMVEVSLN